MNKQNEIHRLDKISTDRKNYKPIFIIILVLIVIAIVLLIIFKDSFKLNSIDTFEESTELLYDKKIEVNFNKINITSDFANIYIEKTNNDYATINIYGESAKAKVDKNDDTLDINLTLTCTVCHNVRSGKILIGIPENKIDDVVINNEYGSLVSDDLGYSITANMGYGNFSATSLDKLDLNLTSGNIKVSTVKDAVINVDIGNVTVNYINNYSNIRANLGNVIVTDMLVQKESLLYSENGSLTIVNAADYYYDASSSSGIITLPDGINKDNTRIVLETVKGNITVGEE